MADKKRCVYDSVPDHTGFHFHRCCRNATHGDYCFQHSPEGRRKQSERQRERWEKQRQNDPLIRSLAQLEKAKKRITKMTSLLKEIYAILESAPELNMSNYDHDQVSLLNDKMTEAYFATQEALKHGQDPQN